MNVMLLAIDQQWARDMDQWNQHDIVTFGTQQQTNEHCGKSLTVSTSTDTT